MSSRCVTCADVQHRHGSDVKLWHGSRRTSGLDIRGCRAICNKHFHTSPSFGKAHDGLKSNPTKLCPLERLNIIAIDCSTHAAPHDSGAKLCSWVACTCSVASSYLQAVSLTALPDCKSCSTLHQVVKTKFDRGSSHPHIHPSTQTFLNMCTYTDTCKHCRGTTRRVPNKHRG
jgi:hypothetical protein